MGRTLENPENLVGLSPVADASARVLVLGSMPGPRSLELGQYYVGRGNRFWRLAADILSMDATVDYEVRVRQLMNRGVALWDVLAACRREGALDVDIERGSEVPNDLASFLNEHSRVTVVALNGRTAAAGFSKFIAPRLGERSGQRVLELPSTSAANARCTWQELRDRWSVALTLGSDFV